MINDVIKVFEVENKTPTASEFKNAFNQANGKDTGKDIKLTAQYCFQEYMLEMSKTKSWADSTYIKNKAIKGIIKDYNENILIDKFDSNELMIYRDFLVEKRKMQNTSVKKHISLLRTFFRWANGKGYMKSTDWQNFNP